MFGPSFSCKSFMYANDAIGIRGAVRRVTCAREPEEFWLHEDLRDNQTRAFEECSWISRWENWFRSGLVEELDDTCDAEDERRKWVEAEHPKRELRRKAWMDIHVDGRTSDHTYTRCINYGVKTGELLARGKYLRAVGDCTTHGSLKLGYFMDKVKGQFQKTYKEGELTLEFVKTPDLAKLREIFAHLISPPSGVYFVFFSDDSCTSVRCADGVLMVNMDISAADGSNFQPIFDTLSGVMSVDSRFNADVSGAFDQLRLPALIRNPENPKEKVILAPVPDAILYSGSVLTTSVNNMANTCIALWFNAYYFFPTMTKEEAVEGLRRAAFDVGYKVKVDVCADYSKLQFLKHSPVYNNDGVLDAIMNIGCLLRGYGTVIGDVPGSSKIPLAQRFRTFNSEVIRGRVHCGNHCINDAFRTKIVSERTVVKQSYLESVITGNQLGYVTSEELGKRYGLTGCRMEELASYIAGADVGEFIATPVLDTIFFADYAYQ